MCSTYNKGKSAFAERVIKTLKVKIYNKMRANDSKSYLSHLNKLVDQYDNTYLHSVDKKPFNANSVLTEKTETNPKPPEFKVNDYRITKYKNIFSKAYNENWLREIFFVNSVFKTNLWTYEIKDLNEEKIIGSFYEK